MPFQGGDLASVRRQLLGQWTIEKQKLDEEPHPDFYFYEREIWWAALGQNVGQEMDGKSKRFTRPALIYKKYSARKCLILPLTTTRKEGWIDHLSVVVGDHPGSVVLNQSRTISSKRLLDKIGRLDPSEFNKVKAAFIKSLN